MDYFVSPNEPYLKMESDFDNLSMKNKTTIRMLGKDISLQGKNSNLYLFHSRFVNNTNIMRGSHVTVREFDTMDFISDEYGPITYTDRLPGR